LVFFTASRPAVGPIQSPLQWVLWASSPGIQQLVHEDDLSFSSVEVKSALGYSLPPFSIHRHVVALNETQGQLF
jgi:hypothetical protein